jgi:hypothetical protein
MSMRLLLVVPDGVGVRNYVHGRFLCVLQRSGVPFNVCTGVPAFTIRLALDGKLEGGCCIEMPLFLESRWSQNIRRTLDVAHLEHFGTTGMRHVLGCRRPKSLLQNKGLRAVTYHLGRVLGTRRGIQTLAEMYERSLRNHPLTEQYRGLLREAGTTLLFVTHQRPPWVFPLVAAARGMGIPTAAFIFSWDNLSSKGRIAAPFDHYLVWSDHMRTELLHYYPDVSADRVHVVGTPQFEPYAYEEFGWTEERFAAETGLCPGRRRVCFSAGDVSTSPNDPKYIAVLGRACREGAFGPDTDIVVRTSPAEDGQRFEPVMREYPELRWCPPRWSLAREGHPEPWSQHVPDASDVDLLKSLTRHCDVNVNMASTMTLDFATADKPVVNVGFGGTPRYPTWFNDSSYYQFEHYAPVLALKSVRFAPEAAALVVAVQNYLAHPSLDAEGRRALLAMQVSVPLHGTSERIVEVLKGIAG